MIFWLVQHCEEEQHELNLLHVADSYRLLSSIFVVRRLHMGAMMTASTVDCLT